MVLKNACKQRHFHAKCLAFYLKILPASEFLPVIRIQWENIVFVPEKGDGLPHPPAADLQ